MSKASEDLERWGDFVASKHCSAADVVRSLLDCDLGRAIDIVDGLTEPEEDEKAEIEEESGGTVRACDWCAE